MYEITNSTWIQTSVHTRDRYNISVLNIIYRHAPCTQCSDTRHYKRMLRMHEPDSRCAYTHERETYQFRYRENNRPRCWPFTNWFSLIRSAWKIILSSKRYSRKISSRFYDRTRRIEMCLMIYLKKKKKNCFREVPPTVYVIDDLICLTDFFFWNRLTAKTRHI